MKSRIASALFLVFVFSALLKMTASANSSWHWISTTRPLTVLPFVVVLTLAVEFFAVKRLNGIENSAKVFYVVCAANLVSFVAPYFLTIIYYMYADGPGGMVYSFAEVLEEIPVYIVGLGYLFLTLLAEVPVVYLSFRKDVENKRKLLVVIIAANIITTVLTAVAERTICTGSW